MAVLMGIMFELTSDPQELRELPRKPARSVKRLHRATPTGIAARSRNTTN